MKLPPQHEQELSAFVALIRDEGCTSYLEIGAKAGGTVAAVGTVLVGARKVVAVDLPKRNNMDQVHLSSVVDRLGGTLVLGDSTNAATIKRVAALAPFDMVFIDANHSSPFVELDWKNYGPMAKRVAFHDLSNVRAPAVLQLWSKLAATHRHVEFRAEAEQYGIGVLWR